MLVRSSSVPMLTSSVHHRPKPLNFNSFSVIPSNRSLLGLVRASSGGDLAKSKVNSGKTHLGSELGHGGGCIGGGKGSSTGYWGDSVDGYYQKMIEVNPSDPLLLGNYAKFLKEVRHDGRKAEAYCARAIVANPDDGMVLCLYADLVWQNQRDASRAGNYFDQAIKVAPDDCYVLASYAQFLWESEEKDEEKITNKNPILVSP